jgi:hypothetical protein
MTQALYAHMNNKRKKNTNQNYDEGAYIGVKSLTTASK